MEGQESTPKATIATSATTTSATANPGSSNDFQMNLLLQLQQTMLNFQSKMTEISLKLIQLETQQQRLEAKVEEDKKTSSCQVSSSSTAPDLSDDISLLAGRMLELENKVDSIDKQQQEQQRQLLTMSMNSTTAGASSEVGGRSGGGSGTGTRSSFTNDQSWISNMQQSSSVDKGAFYFQGTTDMDEDEPEMIISEFDPSSIVEIFGSNEEACVSNVLISDPSSVSSVCIASVVKPYQGNKWFTDRLGKRHNFTVKDCEDRGRRFLCPNPNCTSTTNTKASLIRHWNDKHCDPSQHKCAFCGVIIDVSNGKDALVNHVQKHDDENTARDRPSSVAASAVASTSTAMIPGGEPQQQRFSCKVCPNTFAKAENLACHYTISHYQAAIDNLKMD